MNRCLIVSLKNALAKKNIFPPKNIFFFYPLLRMEFRVGAHMGEKGSKWREAAPAAQKIYRKRARDLFFVRQQQDHQD